jgi:hypothetical protein
VTVFVAVCVVALIGIIGVAVDGGGQMRATERADHVAGEAARAGGQAIDPTTAISGESIVVKPQDAIAAAQAYLQSVGATGTYATKFLPVVGIGSMPVTGHGSATLLHGVTAPE